MSSGKPIDDQDDEELELEPIDPEVLAHEKARTAAHTERLIKHVNVDDILDDQPGRYSDVDLDFSGLRNFRFTTRHLLIVTALLALALTLFELLPPGLAWFLIAISFISAGYFWVYLEEARRAREHQRRREAFHAAGRQPAGADEFDAELEEDRPARLPPEFQFAFSLKQLFIAMTVAVAAIALIRIMGGVGPLAVIFGTLALIGLAVHAAGFDPPPIVILLWWLLLLAYLVLGVVATLTRQASAPPIPVTFVETRNLDEGRLA